MNEGKVIGYFSMKTKTDLFCDGNALVVTGTEENLKSAMELNGITDLSSQRIRKTRFRDIMNGINFGAAYAFDELAYSRFAPIAEQYGIPVQDFDFTPSEEGRIKFLILDPQVGT